MTMRRCVHCQAYTPVDDGKCTVCGNVNKGINLGEQVVRDGLSNDKPSYHIKADGKEIYLHDDRWDMRAFYFRSDLSERTPDGQIRHTGPTYGVTDWEGISRKLGHPVEVDYMEGIAETTIIDDPPYGTRIRYTSDPDKILSLNRRKGWSLGPCPGCGGRTGHVSRYDDGGYSVWCEDCGYETGSDYRKPDYAVDEWNSGGNA